MELDINKYRAFFFDFDGVIADSVNIKTEAFAELYRPYGKDVVAYVVRHHKSHGGMSRFLKIRHYHKELFDQELSGDELKSLADKFSDLVMEKVIQAPLVNGVLDYILILQRQNKKIFIVSGTPEKEIQLIVKKRSLDNYFLEVKGAPTEKAENIQYLMKKYNIDAAESVFFGDSPEDLKAASSLDIKFIPINYSDTGIDGYRDFTGFINKQVKKEKKYG